MSRILIDTLAAAFERGYRGDRTHSLLANLATVPAAAWETRPEQYSEAVFGPRPQLTIADLVRHVGGSKVMYADRAFGPAALTWKDIATPAGEMDEILAWLDEVHEAFAAGLANLSDDTQLAEERPGFSPDQRMTVDQFVWQLTHHDLYHAGEINRQRALVTGAEGWTTSA